MDAADKRDSTTAGPSPQHHARAGRCASCGQVFSGQARFCPFDGERLVDCPEWDPLEDPLIGQTIDGRYKILAVLGEGETGKVYKVQHVALGRRFALKVLRRDFARDAEMVGRFMQEAQAAAAIGHPNIIAVSDFGELSPDEAAESPLPYFVMEYLAGTSLPGLLHAQGPLLPERAGPIFLQAASALGAAHAAGVIHRNLKPANIFVTRTGERDFIKLLDFGVAKIVGRARYTKVGIISGTPHYMSPEQATGQPIDQRVDVYAIGVIMYECFTGRVPFEADTYAEVLRKHATEAPEPIEQHLPKRRSIGELGPITMRCLAKSPKDRFASMAELAAAIEAAMVPILADAGRGRDRTGKRGAADTSPDRRIARVAGVAVGSGVLLALLGWLAMRGNLGAEPVAPPEGMREPSASSAPSAATPPGLSPPPSSVEASPPVPGTAPPTSATPQTAPVAPVENHPAPAASAGLPASSTPALRPSAPPLPTTKPSALREERSELARRAGRPVGGLVQIACWRETWQSSRLLPILGAE